MTADRGLRPPGGNDEAADLIVLGGRVFESGDPRAAMAVGEGAEPLPGEATAVAVRGGLIAAVGSDRQIGALAGRRTTIVEARGGLIMPGFNDAHIHLRMGAISLDRLDLFGLRQLDDVQQAIGRYAQLRPAAPWVVGRGWLYSAFPAGLPTREHLDAVVADRPAYFECFDGHSGWANSRALALAGITRETPDPRDGEIVRDVDGQPTGALKERATEMVEAVLPQPSDEELQRLTLDALRTLARHGVTAAQDAWAQPEDLRLLRSILERDGRLPVRIRLAMELLPGQGAGGVRAKLDEFEAATGSLWRGPWLRAGILKSFTDGVVEARTAAMLEPYAGSSALGDLRWDDGELRAAVAAAHARGWQVELHAIGTRAVRQALDAYAALGADRAAMRRHRVEHIETIEDVDLPRFGRLGIVASMQPLHAVPDASQMEVWSANLQPAVAASGWRLRSLLGSGAPLAFGSDWPVVPFDPLYEIHAAVNRQTIDGWPIDGWLAEERLSVREALAAATYGSAYAEHAEDERGSLDVGKRADLIVLDRDLLAEGAAAVLDARIALAVVDGAIVET